MTEHQTEQIAPHRKNKWYKQAWILGAVAAESMWVFALAAAFAFEAMEDSFPAALKSDLVGRLQTISLLVAFPIGVGGWAFVWGDDPPELLLAHPIVFNLVLPLLFYGSIGALVGTAGKRIGWRFSMRTLLIALTIIALVLGLAALLL
jgi:cation transport ATPase